MLLSRGALPDIAEVKSLFEEYLETHGLRKTPERYAILEEIYRRKDHFDAEDLYVHLKTQRYHVSRATVYNTLDLLVQCELVHKHHFTGNVTLYEAAYGVPEHDHLICTKCGRISEFIAPGVKEMISHVEKEAQFKVTHRAIVLFGQCADGCEEKR